MKHDSIFSAILLRGTARRILSSFSLVIALLLVCAASASATTWIVTDIKDETNATPDCASGTGSTCSVRDALGLAQNGDTITFASSVTGTITLTSGKLVIGTSVNIQGPGANLLTIDANHTSEVFDDSGRVVTISGLTIANGTGSAISEGGPDTLTVTNCTFFSNSGTFGGAIANENGTLTVTNSTFSGNSATANGGAIDNSNGTLTVTNSTFVGNSARDGGGAIYTLASGSPIAASFGTTVSDSTFVGNSARSGGAINIEVDKGAPQAQDTIAANVNNNIFSNNSGTAIAELDQVVNSVTANGTNNLFFNNPGGDSQGDFFENNSETGDPMLLPLGYYGGPTQTLLPQPGSAAICAGLPSAVPTGTMTDQRGFPLLAANCSNGNVDIGSVQTNYLTVESASTGGSCPGATCTLDTAIAMSMVDIDFDSSLGAGPIQSGAFQFISGQVNIVGPSDGITAGLNLQTNPASNLFIDNVIFNSGNAGNSEVSNLGMLVLTNCTFSNNGNKSLGVVFNSGTLTVTNCTFSNNSVSLDAGAIGNAGTAKVTNSTFVGNTSGTAGNPSFGSLNGGAIANVGGALTVTNSTFSSNSASNSGSGGAISNSATLTVTDSTFFDNSASAGSGGAIFNTGTLTLTNNIFSANSAMTAGGNDIDVTGNAPTEGNNLFFNASGGDVVGFTPASTDIIGTDPMLGPLASNGGPTQTLLPLPGSGTQNGSAAICAGNTSLIPAGLTMDQRGFARTTTYSVNATPTTCLDLGSVQTNYAVQFTNIPVSGYSANVNQSLGNAGDAPVVSVKENGQNIGGVAVTLTFTGTGTATGNTATTVAGTGATFSNLTVNARGDDTLSATLNLNPTTATPAISITTNPTATLTINAMPQTITFTGPSSPQLVSTTPISVSATASSGLTVSFASKTMSVCTVSGTNVTLLAPGTCEIEASQLGNSTYAAATPVDQSFNVIFALDLIPTSPTTKMKAPGTVPIILKVQSVPPFTGPVALSCTQTGGPTLPKGWKCPALPTTVHIGSGGSATVDTGVFFPTMTKADTYTITFNGASGTLESFTPVRITIP